MKTLFLFLTLFAAMFLHSQTYVYSAKADGTEDKTNYFYFFNDLVFKCVNCTAAFKDETSFEKHTRVMIENDMVGIVNANGDKNVTDMIDEIGFLIKGKKIVAGTIKKLADGKEEYLESATSDEKKKAFYIKNSKIYSADDKLVAIIDGDEIYGVAWWLMK